MGFKIYSLFNDSYLYHFLFESQVSKINKLKKKPGRTDSSTVVYRLCESLPRDKGYMLFMDNFFTNVKLLTALKYLGIGGCGTAKAGSGFPAESVEICKLSTKKKKKTIGVQKHTPLLQKMCSVLFGRTWEPPKL